MMRKAKEQRIKSGKAKKLCQEAKELLDLIGLVPR
jgi:hypothetical protein